MGTVCVDFENDLPLNFQVDGVFDCPLTTLGELDKAAFEAYPFRVIYTGGVGNAPEWHTGFPPERRRPYGQMVEEILAMWDTVHARSDLATRHEALEDWVLPDGVPTSFTPVVGGTDLVGHVFCRYGWYDHITRNIQRILRAVSTSYLYNSGTVAAQATTFLDSGWTDFAKQSVHTIPPWPEFFYYDITHGKLSWHAGYRRLLLRLDPAGFGSNDGLAIAPALFSAGVNVPVGDSVSAAWSAATLGAGSDSIGAGLSRSETTLPDVIHMTANWIALPSETFLRGGTVSNSRPHSSLRNLYGFPGSPFIRLKGATWTNEGAAPIKLGFCWVEGTSTSLTKAAIIGSTILGDVTSSEQNFDLSPIIDSPWPAPTGASGQVRGVFWIGPEWPTGDVSDVSCRVRYCESTASAATAGAKHMIKWGESTTRYGRIGTDAYPCFIRYGA